MRTQRMEYANHAYKGFVFRRGLNRSLRQGSIGTPLDNWQQGFPDSSDYKGKIKTGGTMSQHHN